MASPTSIKKLDKWLILQNWKEGKEKRRQEEKQKAKPVFKVCRVPDEFGLPNSVNLNKKIKGKPNKANVCHTSAPKASLFKSNIFCSLEEDRLLSRLTRKEDTVQLRNKGGRPCNQQLKKFNEAKNSHSKMSRTNLKPSSSKQETADCKMKIKNAKSKMKETTQWSIKVGDNNANCSPNNNNTNENHRSIPANVQEIKRRLRKSYSNPELKKLYRSDTKPQNFTMEPGSPHYATDKNSTVLNNSFHTPQNNNIYEDSIYVTASRGTCNARNMYHLRRFTGELTPEFAGDILSNTRAETGAEYFLRKLNDEKNRIEGICAKWECYKSSNKLPERANDMINVAIGWSRLLISNKFEQLRNLCVSYDELHGIWDTIQVQIECLIKRFDDLNAMKANNWQEILPKDEGVLKRGRGRPKSKKVLARNVLENLTKAANDANKSCVEDEINLNVPQIDDNKASSGVASSVGTLKEPSREFLARLRIG